MNAEWEIEGSLITGLMFGIEFPPVDEINEDMRFAMVIDIGIVRLTIVRWKLTEE
jgi:hypothetical protein